MGMHMIPLTTHCSPLTAHQSLLTTHYPPLTTNHPPLSTRLSPLATRHSPLATNAISTCISLRCRTSAQVVDLEAVVTIKLEMFPDSFDLQMAGNRKAFLSCCEAPWREPCTQSWPQPTPPLAMQRQQDKPVTSVSHPTLRQGSQR